MNYFIYISHAYYDVARVARWINWALQIHVANYILGDANLGHEESGQIWHPNQTLLLCVLPYFVVSLVFLAEAITDTSPHSATIIEMWKNQ